MYIIEGPWASAGINVKSPGYNAKGDGSTDDWAALQAAVNDASSAKTSVYLPAGTYMVSQPISIPAGEGLNIIGSGWGTRLKLMAGKNCFVLQMTGFDTRIAVRDLTIDGNCTQQGLPGTSGGIDASGAIACRFDNIRFTACRDDALFLGGMLTTAFGRGNKIVKCLFDQSTASTGPGRGIHMFLNNGNQILSSSFESLGGSGGSGSLTAVAILDRAGSQTVMGCNFSGGSTNVTKGVRVQDVTGTTIANCTFDNVAGDNVFIAGANCTVVDNTMTGIGSAAPAGTVSGIHLESGAANTTVQGNTIVSAATNGAGRSLIREENLGVTGNSNIQGNTLVVAGTLSVSIMELAATGTLVRGNQGASTVGDPADSRYLLLTGGTLTGGLSGTTFTASGTSQLSNIRLGSGGSFGGGTGGMLLVTNAATPPSTNPSSGAVLYAEGGVVKVKQSDGTIVFVRNPLARIATALQNNSTTTQTASTFLTIPVEASAVYQMRGFLVVQSPAGVSFTHSFTGPTGATMVWGDATATSIATLTGVDTWSGSGANKTAIIMGQLNTSTTAGNLVLTFASGTAGQTATLGAGSWLELAKVG